MELARKIIGCLGLIILWYGLASLSIAATKYINRPHDLELRLAVAENEIITLRAENRNLKKLLEESNAR